ncbi:sigma 54-interacting transcriptional regulator [Pradoshia sp.]|uniref:sigma 54-interacting transcriptional regulator n=1 Tax=Pradoshia sp. TaxID=2651281 RepID=UPI003F041F09
MSPLEHCLSPTNTLRDAIEIMHNQKWNTVPVTNQSGKLIGVFTRSSMYQMILSDVPKDTPISDYIKKAVGTVLEDVNSELLETMIAKSRVGTGIIINKSGKPVGLFTKTNAVMNYVKETQILKKQLEKVMDTSNLGAIMTNEDGTIIFANEKCAEMIGMPLAEITGEDMEAFVPAVSRYADEREAHFPMVFHQQHFIVRLSKYSIDNQKEGYIALFQNVSELEKLTAELESQKKWKTLLQSVIHNAYDGLVMINEQEEITFISPSLLELFELDKEMKEKDKITKVLPHLSLEQVMKTGVAEVSDFMEIKGINYLVHRIPVYQGERIIGAIGKIVYRQLHEVREAFKSAEDNRKVIHKQEGIEKSRFTFNEILSKDKQMDKLIRSGTKAAKSKTTILLYGESGTGKELFAHAIHSSSTNSRGPFITVNCAAIPEHLLESEFFGYEDGAFTGAKQKGKIGKFDLAHGGTLFLDEIGDMSLPIQAKLLRVLQEREFYRVGGTERIKVDVRIIAATNRPLERMVADGTFREDLFYRLNVISFEIPPLRKRKKDILLLSESFIRELNRQNGTSITGWEPLFEQAIMDYDWPGNIRELRNVWERAMIFAENGKVRLEDLPDYVLKNAGYDVFLQEEEEMTPQPLLEKAEQFAIQKALQMSGGNKSKACILLGISRSVLYDKLKKYNVPAFKEQRSGNSERKDEG